jgi:hypothetical protein
MQRPQLEHLIRASAAITGSREFIVIGSQALLGQFPDPPEELLVSIEADLFTPGNPADSDLIDGSIGQASPFHRAFGYYAHGVGPETAVLPKGWQERLVPLRNENTGGATALCLEVHDLAASKLVAAREKDLDFLHGLLFHRLASRDILRQRVRDLPVPSELQQACSGRLERLMEAGN